MRLEDQFVSLPLAKKMKEAGCTESAEFCWAPGLFVKFPCFVLNRCFGQLPAEDCYFAYSVAELGEALPPIISVKVKGASMWAIYLNSGDHKGDGDIFEAPTEADARAVMWLYLREKGLI